MINLDLLFSILLFSGAIATMVIVLATPYREMSIHEKKVFDTAFLAAISSIAVGIVGKLLLITSIL
jgi:hypothetical protein